MGVFTNSQGFHCQMLTGGMPFSLSLPLSQCVVPQGLNGAVAIWITSDDQPLNGGVVDRQSNAIVAGPLLTFIDIEVDIVSTLIRKKGGSSGSGSSSSSNSSSSNSSSSYDPGMNNSGSGSASSFASTTTVSPSDAGALVSGLPLSTVASSASGSSATSSAAAPDNVIANGVSMVPNPTASGSGSASAPAPTSTSA
jgi:hypothetical protein